MSSSLRTFPHWLLILLAFLSMGGCATVEGPRDPRDPWEGYNRAMFEFNDAVDRAVVKPMAKGYRAITPDPVDKGVTNFFSNLDDVRVALYNLLQLKPKAATQDIGRVVWNTTVGLLGIIDVASELGLPKHDEDFGQVLGYWGVPSGPYLVLPLFGPSTVRDAPGIYADWQFSAIQDFWGYPEEYYIAALNLLDKRADLIPFEGVADEIAFDRYITIRDAYLQRREYLVYDGNPPQAEDPLLQELKMLDEGGGSP